MGQRVVGALGPLTAGHPWASTAAVLGSIGSWLEHFRGPVVYVLCGLLVFGEAAVLLGFVIPGETAALIGGALASLHHVSLVVVLVVVVVGAIAGDSVGYEVGKFLGPWLLERRPLRGHPGVQRGQELLARFGGPAVFLGRWVALARALVPGLTGMSGMRYRTFLFYNALGGITWGVAFVMIGFAAGRSYAAVARTVGTYSLVVVGTVVVAVVGVVMVRRRRDRRGSGAGPAEGRP
jgi:membrane protein DedA with SNARE-associated domain